MKKQILVVMIWVIGLFLLSVGCSSGSSNMGTDPIQPVQDQLTNHGSPPQDQVTNPADPSHQADVVNWLEISLTDSTPVTLPSGVAGTVTVYYYIRVNENTPVVSQKARLDSYAYVGLPDEFLNKNVKYLRSNTVSIPATDVETYYDVEVWALQGNPSGQNPPKTAIWTHAVHVLPPDIPTDETAPAITYTILDANGDDPANGVWFNSTNKFPVTVTFSATDPDDDANDLTVTPPSVTVSNEGITTVSCTAEDPAGNENTITAEVHIDTIAPEIAVGKGTPGGGDLWYNFADKEAGNVPVAVTVTATDASPGSDNVSIVCTLEGNPVGNTFDVTEEGVNNIHVVATDLAGNSSTKDDEVKIDTVPPTVTARPPNPNSPNGEWFNAAYGPYPVVVDVDATDETSGVASQEADGSFTDDGKYDNLVYCATDNAGNEGCSDATHVWIDTVKPTVDITTNPASPNAAGWFKTDVDVTLTAADATSGWASFACAPYSASTNPGTFTVSTEAQNVISATATDLAGNTSDPATKNVWIDKTAPVITINTPAAGATYILNQAVASSWSVTDALSGVASCGGTVVSGGNIPMASPGANDFTVEATDVAGNTNSLTNTYYVHFTWTGNFFLPPITANGTGLFKLGCNIPVKCKLYDANGVSVYNTVGLDAIASIRFLNYDTNVLPGDAYEVDDPSTSGLRYDSSAGQYIYNWKTTGLAVGHYMFQVDLLDGTTQQIGLYLK